MMLALLLLPLAHAGSVHADQARIYARQGYPADALAEVEAGLADPNPADALELYAIGVDAAYALGDIDRVLRWSQQAADRAVSPEAHEQWQARHDAVAAAWGWVRVTGSRGGVQLEAAEPVLDPDQKRVAAGIVTRAASARGGELRVALPVGAWRVDGRAVQVVAGETAEVATVAPARRMHARLGPGVQAAIGDRLAVAPVLEGGVDAALGPCTLGAAVRWAPEPRVSAAGVPELALDAGGAALWVGAPLRPVTELVVQPALGLRAAWIPGDGGGRWGIGPAARLAVGAAGAVPVGVAVDGAWWPGAGGGALALGVYVGR